MSGKYKIALWAVLSGPWTAYAGGTIGTTFTYQGQLKQSGAPVSGSADFKFSLWAHPTDVDPADQVGGPLTVSDVGVVNGLFDVQLDFGASAFNGLDRWLQVQVRTPHDPANLAPFTTLSVRQPVSPTPYAVKAFSTVGVDGHSLDAADGSPFDAVFVDNNGNVSIDSRLIFSSGTTPLITAGHDNNAARPNRMWIGHSQAFPSWGIQYRDIDSDGLSNDAIEFVAGDTAVPRFRFDLPNRNLELLDSNGRVTTRINGQAGGGGGGMTMLNGLGNQTVEVDSDEGSSPVIRLNNSTNTHNRVYIAAAEGAQGAEMHLRNAAGATTIQLDADEGDSGGIVVLDNSNGIATIELDADETESPAIRMRNAAGTQDRIYIAASEGAEGAEMHLRNAAGVTTIQLDADAGGTGDGRVVTNELQITGGSDLSEQFDVNVSHEATEPRSDEGQGRERKRPDPSAADEAIGTNADATRGRERTDEVREVQAGMVVSIDPRNPGELRVSTEAYDRTVAGIVSGAGGVKTGMLMGQPGTLADGKYPVALSGRVYCWCDASNGPIRPGDLLTSADRPGHAMRGTDSARAQGSVIGKAMTSLNEGQGLVLVLVSLQ